MRGDVEVGSPPDARGFALEHGLRPVDEYGPILSPGRLRAAVGRPQNWLQLFRFGLIGGSGYAVNLSAFAVCVHVLGLDYRLAAVVAFLCAVGNNFYWNRRWTFTSRDVPFRSQAIRFAAISVAAFLMSFVILVLITDLHVVVLAAQVIAVALVTPLSFAGNKLWTFQRVVTAEREHGR
jgi:putative flippase GtrA